MATINDDIRAIKAMNDFLTTRVQVLNSKGYTHYVKGVIGPNGNYFPLDSEGYPIYEKQLTPEEVLRRSVGPCYSNSVGQMHSETTQYVNKPNFPGPELMHRY